MTDAEIIALAEIMRRHQREFYSFARPEDRPPGLLKQCKDLERRLDAALEARRNGQGRLFGPEAG
jgi:inhibitor of KinA sporulation pathway (predicted exonuclease)